MAKPDPDPLTRWRDAEAAYAEALKAYLVDGDEPAALSKKVLLEMVDMRGKADRWREKYFRKSAKN